MALLNEILPRKGLLRGCAVALALTVAACSLSVFGDDGPERMAFSHNIHLEEGLECGDCHMGIEDGDEPGMPVLAGCLLCHESMEDEDTPPEKRVATLFDADGKMLAAKLSELPDETVFSHLRHVEAELDCAECHVGIDTAETIDEDVIVTMDDCMDCHSSKAVPNECLTCHTEYDVDLLPPSHEQNWDKVHGQVFRAKMDGRVNDCSLCHAESTCVSCHRDEEPESHNNYFRLRGHGIQASIDRDSCAACHRTESCDRCHSETSPLSHNSASWGGERSNHCVGCHEPLRSTSCATCHRGTPSHRMAPPMPPGHLASTNCRACHGIDAPLRHADNGSDCTSCHR